jgi:hypothetical protein
MHLTLKDKIRLQLKAVEIARKRYENNKTDLNLAEYQEQIKWLEILMKVKA